VLRRFGRDVAIYGGADLLFKLAGFFIIPVYAHLISVTEFGLMALLTVSGTLVGAFINMGVNNAVQRFYFDPGQEKERQRLIVSTGLIQLLSTGAAILALAALLLGWAREEIHREYGLEWIWIALVLANVLPEQLAQYTLDATRLHFSPWRFFSISLVKNVLGIVLGLLFLAVGDMGLTGIFLGTLLGNLLAAPLGILLIRRDLTFRFDPELARAIFRFGYPFVFASAAYWVFGSMDRWLLMEMSTAEQVGLFSIAFKFAALISFVITAFAQAWIPHALRLMRDEPGYRSVIGHVFPLWFFALALVGLVLALFASEAMVLLTPPEYWGAAPILAVGAAGMVLYGTTQITALGINLVKRTTLFSTGAWFAAGVNVVLNLLLIPRFGAVGSAFATFFAYAALTGFFLFWGQKLHPIPLEKGQLAYCLGLVFLALAVPLLFPGTQGVDPGVVAAKLALLAAALGGGLVTGILRREWLRALRPASGGPTLG
jgi:O-antigen/teichoic acid export membrane protein